MQFLKFKQQFSKYPAFSIKEIEKLYPGFNKMNLLRWQKKEYIQKLRNSWYCFTDNKPDETFLFYIANKIYNPSYISLETALMYHGLIPEAVFLISSVTTLKTKKFKNNLGFFTYSNIKSNCFFGYQLVKKETYVFKIANIEKALLDYLYIRNAIKTRKDIEALRLNKQILQENLDLQKLFDYTNVYKSKTLLKKIQILNQFLDA